MRNYSKIIENLYLPKVSVGEVEQLDGHDILTIYGGFNGNGIISEYLIEAGDIVNELIAQLGISYNDVWLIDWVNNVIDDKWILRLGVTNN